MVFDAFWKVIEAATWTDWMEALRGMGLLWSCGEILILVESYLQLNTMRTMIGKGEENLQFQSCKWLVEI